MDKEIAKLRRAQARAVMPLIGGLLDAWDGMSNDLRGQIEYEKPAFENVMESIRAAMEGEEA